MSRPDTPPHDAAVRRACLPEILFLADLALALQVAEPEAAQLVLDGACGPYLRIGGRLAVRRDTLLAALATRERHVLPPLEPGSAPEGEQR